MINNTVKQKLMPSYVAKSYGLIVDGWRYV